MFSQEITDLILWYTTFNNANLAMPLWYAISYAFVLIISLLWYGAFSLTTVIWLPTTSFILKHVIYRHVVRRIPFIGAITWWETLLAISHVAVNITCVTVGVASISEVSTRAAIMSAINLIPLLCGPRLILMTELIGISLRSHLGFHKWLGRTSIIQALLHTVLSVVNNRPFQWTTGNTYGVIVSTEPIISKLRLMLSLGRLVSWSNPSFIAQYPSTHVLRVVSPITPSSYYCRYDRYMASSFIK
jgi:hypothetical protein